MVKKHNVDLNAATSIARRTGYEVAIKKAIG